MNHTLDRTENFLVTQPGGQIATLARQSIMLTGRLTPAGARLLIRHSFASAEAEPLELVYAFALPRDSAMRQFRLSGPGFVVRSELRPAHAARETYENAIQDGHRTALAAQHDDGVVNLSLGNVKPGEQLTLWLEMMAGVEADDEGYRFRFPFALPPRYHAGARYGRTDAGDLEMELPDEFGSVLLPGWTDNHDAVPAVGFLLEAAAEGGVAAVSSPSHPVEFAIRPDERVRVSARSEAEVPDCDLEIHVRGRSKSAMVLAGPAHDRLQAAALVPVPAPPAGTKTSRRVVFLIDISGSMQGVRIEQARRAVQACLGFLTPDDQFAIFAYESDVHAIVPRMTDATPDAIRSARAAVAHLEPMGGTELAPALRKVIAAMNRSAGDILLVTDGDVAGTENAFAAMRRAGIRLHALGVETAAAERFLVQLATGSGGTCRCMSTGGRVESEVLKLFRAVGASLPIRSVRAEGLTDLRIEPPLPPTVAPGTVLPVFLSGGANGTPRLVIEFGEESATATVEIPLTPGTASDGEFARLLRGARLLTDAEFASPEPLANSRSAKRRKKDASRTLLADIGTEYGLACKALSLVAVVEQEGDLPGELPKTIVLQAAHPRMIERSAYAAAAGGYYSAARNVTFYQLASPDVTDDVEHVDCLNSSLFMHLDALDEPPLSYSDLLTPEEQPPNSDIETIWECIATLEPDGGVPAPDPAHRAPLTMALVLLLLQHLTGAKADQFDLLVGRMTAFLDAQNLTGPDAEAFARVQKAIADRRALDGEWADLLQTPERIIAAILAAQPA